MAWYCGGPGPPGVRVIVYCAYGLRLLRKIAGPAAPRRGVHGRARLPERARLPRAGRGVHARRLEALEAGADDRGAEAEGARRGTVEPVPTRERIRRRTDQR